MNLATRCAHCGTVFRVVLDQLRVSEGWVRCGRCDAVFNAADALFDVDTGEALVVEGLATSATPPVTTSNAPAEVRATPDRQPLAPADDALRHEPGLADPGDRRQADPDHDPLAHVVPADWAQHQERRALAAAQASAQTSTQAQAALGQDSPGPLLKAPSVQADEDMGHQMLGWMRPSKRGTPDAHGAEHTGASAAAPAEDPNAPSFVRAAQRSAFWRRPALRSALLGATGVLAVSLVLQLGLLWRDPLAAHAPALAPALRGLCKLSGCAVQPLRRIEQISVDSSGLNRLDGSPLYRFAAVLRNRADTPLLLPALELSLTDNQGKLVARRVLQASELGLPRDVLDRGQDLPIKLLLSTGDQRVDGYTLELFYP